MTSKDNLINWLEIPVTDISRAMKFYESVLDTKLELMEMMGAPYAVFPYEPGSGKISGALAQGDMYKPSADGVRIYLNCPDIEATLIKVGEAGGKVILPKTKIEDQGYMAFFSDSEGNTIGMHSNK
ncbi:MAG: VOC family protein [Cyclobacteriaceae bacterium]|nr:VOC family protein [Cyclobacteriaceae bacterium]